MLGKPILYDTNNMTLVLVRPQGPINVGMVARVCGNLGVTDLRLVMTQCDIASDACKMFAHHAKHLLQNCKQYSSLALAAKDCDLIIGTSARTTSRVLQCNMQQLHSMVEARHAQKIALVFGNEAGGLTHEEAQTCHVLLQLETPGFYHSYNLSHAVAIVLYTLLCTHDATHTQQSVPKRHLPANAQRVSKLFDTWLRVLDKTGYFAKIDGRRFAPKLQGMLQRWGLSNHDVDALHGILRHLHRK